QPLGALDRLALGTVPVAAGVIGDAAVVGLLTAAAVMALWGAEASRTWGGAVVQIGGSTRFKSNEEYQRYWRARETWEARALFFGLGTGLLAFGVTTGLALLRRMDRGRTLHVPGRATPSITDTRIGQTQSWHPSALSTRGQLMHSMQSHRFLWFSCIFLTGVILVLVAYPFYLKWHDGKHSSDYIYPDPIWFWSRFFVGVLMTLLISVTLIAAHAGGPLRLRSTRSYRHARSAWISDSTQLWALSRRSETPVIRSPLTRDYLISN